MSGAKNILVAGIGNIFFGDDAFGCEVTRRLLERPWPEGVRVRDFGIRGVDLAYELLEGYDGVVLVDAAPVGEQPGDLAVIEPTAGEEDGESEAAAEWDSHSMNPVNVLRMARRLGATWGRMLLVGCQPTPIAAEDDIAPGLSEAVARAVELAAELVAALVAELVAANELRAAPAELTKHN